MPSGSNRREARPRPDSCLCAASPTRSDDGRAGGVHHNTAERDGKHLDFGCCIVFEVKDGRITDGREHFSDLYAWDEFWS